MSVITIQEAAAVPLVGHDPIRQMKASLQKGFSLWQIENFYLERFYSTMPNNVGACTDCAATHSMVAADSDALGPEALISIMLLFGIVLKQDRRASGGAIDGDVA